MLDELEHENTDNSTIPEACTVKQSIPSAITFPYEKPA